MGGLVAQRALVQEVAKQTEGEDGRGQGVASGSGVAVEEACQDLVAIL